MHTGVSIAAEFGWPPAALARPLPRVESAISIARPADAVFAYVTTPALWHTWHPATASVQDVPNRPLVTGETMRERIAAAGRRFDALWTVLACDAPRLWVIATATPHGDARIVYRIDDAPRRAASIARLTSGRGAGRGRRSTAT